MFCEFKLSASKKCFIFGRWFFVTSCCHSHVPEHFMSDETGWISTKDIFGLYIIWMIHYKHLKQKDCLKSPHVLVSKPINFNFPSSNTEQHTIALLSRLEKFGFWWWVEWPNRRLANVAMAAWNHKCSLDSLINHIYNGIRFSPCRTKTTGISFSLILVDHVWFKKCNVPREFMNSTVEIAVMWARVPLDSRHVVARLFDGILFETRKHKNMESKQLWSRAST